MKIKTEKQVWLISLGVVWFTAREKGFDIIFFFRCPFLVQKSLRILFLGGKKMPQEKKKKFALYKAICIKNIKTATFQRPVEILCVQIQKAE